MPKKNPSQEEIYKATIKHLENQIKVLEITHQNDFEQLILTNEELREAEKRESEEKFRDLFENTTDLIQSVNLDGSFVYVNNSWLTSLGYRKEDISNISIFDIIHPDYHEHCKEMFQQIMSGKTVNNFETVFVSNKGNEITVEGNVNAKYENGEFVSTRGIFRDITERKKAEKERKNLENKLIQSEKSTALVRVVAGIAHEINNPLSAVQSDLYTITQYAGKLPDSKQQQKILKIANRDLEAISRATEIVLAMKSTHRPEEWHLTDLNNEIDTVLTLYHKQYKNRIKITKDYSSLPQVNVHGNDIGQVIGNLLMNAIDSIPEKGEITLSTKEIEDYISLSVKDTGGGIPEEIQNHIFDPFYTTKGVGKGTGLGLSLSYQIAEKHEGRLYVAETKQGTGSTFTLELPMEVKK